MLQVRTLAVVMLTGCTMVNPSPKQHAASLAGHHATVALHPLNCGTPDQFKICPVPVPVSFRTEELEDLTPLPEGMKVEVEELDSASLPVPDPPVVTQQAIVPVPAPPEAPPAAEPPPAPTVLSQTLTRLRDE